MAKGRVRPAPAPGREQSGERHLGQSPLNTRVAHARAGRARAWLLQLASSALNMRVVNAACRSAWPARPWLTMGSERLKQRHVRRPVGWDLAVKCVRRATSPGLCIASFPIATRVRPVQTRIAARAPHTFG